MDHDQAIQTQASIRYVLGELTPAERDSFEEHYADCSRCLNDVEMATAFAANAREVFRGRAAAGDGPKRVAWFGWRPFPAFALSAALNLVLLAGLGYRLVPVHSARSRDSGKPAALESAQTVLVRGTTRGSDDGGQEVQASARQPLILRYVLLEHYEHYYYSIDRDGARVLSDEIPGPDHEDSLSARIPGGVLSPGDYVVTITGKNGGEPEELGRRRIRVAAPGPQ